MKLIVGLGNIGEKYKNTRHNVGFEVIDKLAIGNGFSNFENVAFISKVRDVIFVKPTIFMNNSGIAVRKLADYYKIDVKDILIICDDCNLNPGNIRLKTNGSSAGHNGLKSIIAHLGTENFCRLKLGIGAARSSAELADFVLSKFNQSEMKILEETILDAVNAVNTWISDGSEKVMQNFNKKNV